MTIFENMAMLLIVVEILLVLSGGIAWHASSTAGAIIMFLGLLSWIASFVLFFTTPGAQYNLFDWATSMTLAQGVDLAPLNTALIWLLLFVAPSALSAFIASR